MGSGIGPSSISRREFLGVAGGLAAGAALTSGAQVLASEMSSGSDLISTEGVEPYFGLHQAGITTAKQSYSQFAAFDVITDDRLQLARLLQTWTSVSAKLCAGGQADSSATTPQSAPPDSGETLGLDAGRLTINVGFGPTLFGIGGPDRFGLRDQAPVPLVEIPPFSGDDIAPVARGGDLTIHACSDDPQVAFHALRQLGRAASGVATLRWRQSGFSDSNRGHVTGRNLLGFKDGTTNPTATQELDVFVWVGDEGPDWMTGGTYTVARRIRVALGAWDLTSLDAQEAAIGRHKATGAPLGQPNEFDALDLSARTPDGELAIPLDAHVRLASPEENWGTMMLRRSYNYDNGAIEGENGPVSDAGMFFVSYQRYPLVAFIPVFRKLADNDPLMRFTIHTASAIAAIPAGVVDAEDWIGRRLFES